MIDRRANWLLRCVVRHLLDQRGVLNAASALNPTNLIDKAGDDTPSGSYGFTKSVGTAGGYNFVDKSDFEDWTNGVSAAPDGWTLNGAGATIAKDTTNFKVTAAAAALTRAGTDCYLSQRLDLLAMSGPATLWGSRKVTLGCWVRATVAARARIAVNDGTTTTFSGYHTGDSTFQLLVVTATLQAVPTAVEVRLYVDTGNTTAQFDGAILVLGANIQDYVPGLRIAAKQTIVDFNYTFNGDMEIWGAGTTAAPTGWALSGAGATIAKDTTTFRFSAAAAAITRAGTDCFLFLNVAGILDFGPVTRWQNRKVTLGCWVFGTVGNSAFVEINDGVGTSTGVAHTGNSTWQFLTVTRQIDAAATKVELRLSVKNANNVVQFDGAMMVDGDAINSAFIDSAWADRTVEIAGGGVTSQAQATTFFYNVAGQSATEIQVSSPILRHSVARNLRVLVDAAPPAGQTLVVTLRKNETTDTALTVTIDSTGRAQVDATHEVELAAGDQWSIKVVSSATAGARFVHWAFELETAP